MKIILMRHGEAHRQQGNDAQRQLTDFGHKQAEQTAKYILEKYKPDVLIASPYDRAQQTMASFASRLPNIHIKVNELITPEDDPMLALKSLMDIDAKCVLIVCHMPIVAKIAALIDAGYPQPFALAEARVFDAEFMAPDMGNQVDKFVPIQP